MAPLQRFLAGLGLAASIALPATAQTCLQPAEQAALAVRALQSQLMVVALSCGQHDDYNAFVTRNKQELGTAWRQVAGHFRRVHGGAGQRELDNYITTLANAQSQEGIRQGSHFCQNAAPLFRQALAQQGLPALASLSLEQKVTNPYGAEACPAPATRSAQASPARRPQATTQVAAAR
ncbi:hypothetical protein NON00_15330 [Roseomonas sp. GC11]|uniref:hypothetical protein n=1 Tax=Roseomonas sp. GC11 TaxID=2950546 RepID=UPI00210D11FC|nr:hypothetical protein [Roseomonas sp. GC11]MCQ4161292.1 hypothetical protein [Roseomonas sp. GC11]